jgi:hypothetical protein
MDQKEFRQLLEGVAKQADTLPKWTQEYFEVHYGSVTSPQKETAPTTQTAPTNPQEVPTRTKASE